MTDCNFDDPIKRRQCKINELAGFHPENESRPVFGHVKYAIPGSKQDDKRYKRKTFSPEDIFRLERFDPKALNTKFTRMTGKQVTDISPSARDHMGLVMASKIGNRYGINEAEEYFRDNFGSRFKIDRELSDEDGLVAYNPETNEARLGFRGTDPKKSMFKDMSAWAEGYLNINPSHPHFTKAEEMFNKANAKYNVKGITGYSLGGAKALHLGTKYNVNTRVFNPLVGTQIMKRAGNNTAIHKIYRTESDIATHGTLGESEVPKNVKIYTVSSEPTLHPIRPHLPHTFLHKSDPLTARPKTLQEYPELTLKDKLNPVRIKTMLTSSKIMRSIPEMGSGFLASGIVNSLDPHNKLGEQGDLLATTGINTALDASYAGLTSGIGSIIAGGSTGSILSNAGKAALASASESLPSLLSAYEAGDQTNKLMSKITSGMKNRRLAGAIDGSISGMSSVGAGMATTKGLQMAKSGIQSGIKFASKVASPIVEDATTTGTELADLGTEAALTGVSEGAADVAAADFWNPLGWAAGILALGSGIGAAVGSLSGDTHTHSTPHWQYEK